MGNSPSSSCSPVGGIYAKTFEELSTHVALANEWVSKYTDSSGRKYHFELLPRNKSDVLVSGLWKVLVHVQVTWVPTDSEPPKKLLFKQFYQVYAQLRDLTAQTPSSSSGTPLPSALFSEYPPPADKECLICMEKEATLVLPCYHCFCEDCISLWKRKSSTCPVCRVTVADVQTNDCFVLAKPLTDAEIHTHFTSFLDTLKHKGIENEKK